MSNISVVTNNVVTTATIEVVKINHVNLDLNNSTISAYVEMIDTNNNNVIVRTQHVNISGADYDSVFNYNTFKSLILTAVGEVEATI